MLTQLFPGFQERIKYDLCTSMKDDVDTFSYASSVNVFASRERKNAAWIGAAALASMWSTFQQQKISRADYDEHGAAIVKRKCIR